MPEPTDEQLAAEAQRGSQPALTALFKRYTERLLRYAISIVKSGDEAHDVVQEAFIKAYMNLKSFDTKRKFSSWIYRIVHNEAMNHIRRESRRPWISLDADTVLPLPASEKPDPLEEQMTAEEKQEMQDAIHSLPVKYREVVELRYLQEFSYEEIADILTIPQATVGVRLSRAKSLLKKKIL
ncbi:MAG: RNA polymerase sigma factor [Patescibacteria group bacterium]|jgi:RNA polymerase sigma-70 factor (ECF subfamily)